MALARPARRPTGSSGRAREEVRVLHTFTVDGAAALAGPEWLRRRRAEAFADFEASPLPSEKEEVWRYTPVDRLDLGAYQPAGPPAAGAPADPGLEELVAGVMADLPVRSALVVVVDGYPVRVDRAGLPEGVMVGRLVADGDDGDASSRAAAGSGAAAGGGRDDRPLLGSVLTGGDALVRLHDAFVPDAVVVDVAAGVSLADPVVVVHWCAGAAVGGPSDAGEGTTAAAGTGVGRAGEQATATTPGEGAGGAPAVFPHTVVRLGTGAQAEVVEVTAGAPGDRPALVVPVVELDVGDGADLAYVALQVLGTGAWHLGRLAARAGRDARLRTFTVGLGGVYDRLRTGASAAGPGAHCELRSAYLGTGEQVHDVRTLQDHQAPHTTSDLLCKGAVAGTARSVYSGLIRVRHGAVRTEAFQTNHNLVLDERAHADSVPNLDIEENDVRCSHASTVGPVDEDQRYYLESRGVPPARAEQLIVLGFFDDIVERSPVPAAVDRLRREVGIRLADALGLGGTADVPSMGMVGPHASEEPAIRERDSGRPGGLGDGHG